MHILVTGGSGFIGQALCPSLVQDGHRVSVLTRDPARAQERLPPLVRCVAALEDLREVEAVINLQGENLGAGRWTAARKQAFADSRVGFTAQLVRWMQAQSAPPGVLISGSAIGWYGDRGDQVLDEHSAPGDDFAAGLCRDWEAAALAAQSSATRVCCVRIGVVLDAGGGALAQMLPAFRFGLGGSLGRGQQWMSWISRPDLVRLLQWLLKRDATQGAYNATAPQPVPQRRFAAALGRCLRRPAVLPMPAPVLRLLLGEMAGLLLGSQRVLPAAALAQGFAFQHADVDAALEALLR